MHVRTLAIHTLLVLSAATLAACGGDEPAGQPPGSGGDPGSTPPGSVDGMGMGMGSLPAGHPPTGGMPSPGPLREGVESGGGSGMGGHGAAPAGPESPLAWTVPEGWTERPGSNMMRLAEFDTGADGAEFVIYGGITGGADANLNRWISEFSQSDGSKSKDKAEVTKRDVDGVTVHRIELTGTYKKANMVGGVVAEAQAQTKLLGAVVEVGGESIFVKFTGPEEAVSAAEANFDALLDSMKLR